MQRRCHFASPLLLLVAVSSVLAEDWRQFRGPGGLGISTEKGLPSEWSSEKNLRWKTKLPGAGASSPVTVGDHVFLTCYSGYGMDAKAPGKMEDLLRHVVCVGKNNGKIVWTTEFEPVLPEHKYAGEGSYHGYAASTIATDGKWLYVFFGKSGIYCFDLEGKEKWHVSVGKGINGWGSGASPLLTKDLVIVNASIESGALVALNKMTGDEVWRAKGVSSAWNTPVLVTVPPQDNGGKAGVELVVSAQDWLMGFELEKGKELWRAEGVHRYVCPSVTAHDGIVYAIGGGHTSVAVRAGGRGDVTKTHTLWRFKKGSNVSSPIVHDGHVYWANDSGGVVHCQKAATGEFVYSERLVPDSGLIYASPVLADGKLYYLSQRNGTFVVGAGPKFKLLAHNAFEDDKSRANASPAVFGRHLLLRSDQYLYCIGDK